MDALLREIHRHPYISAGIAFALVATSPLMTALRAVAKKIGEKALGVAGSLVITSIELNDIQTTEAVSVFLSRTGRTHSVGGDCYDLLPHTFTTGKTRHIFYRKVADSLSLYFYKGAPILLTPIARDADGDMVKRSQMRFINGTVNMKDLLTDAGEFLDLAKEEETRSKRAFSIVTISPDAAGTGISIDHEFKSTEPSTAWRDAGEPVNFDPAEDPAPHATPFSHRLSFTDAHRMLFQDVRFWKENRQWYVDAELEYKRGYLLHGKPGTGKTSLISAVAHDLDIPVVIINVAGMSDAQFLRAWKQGSEKFGQRIVLFEDFDTVFHGRKNVTGTLNFTTVLNAIDGIQGNAGCLLFITTNHIDQIDEAIGRPDENGESTRSGRVDVIIEIPELDYEGRLKICKRILRDDIEAKAMADSSPVTESPSGLTGRCKRRAVALLWDNKQ